MIGTITLNPSVDISYYLDIFFINDVNRTSNYFKTAGGKGINVSKVLRQLGCPVTAICLLGGGNGRFIEEELKSLAVTPLSTPIQEVTRNCIAIIENGRQTEILETGPEITEEEGENFLQLFVEQLTKGDLQVVAASGSLPRGLNPAFYRVLIDQAHQQNVKFVLDTSGTALKEAIRSAPYLIKPNISELEDLLGRKIQSEQELLDVLPNLKMYDIAMVVVSLGKEGCIALCGDDIYKVTTPDVPVKSPIGSGDAMLAGMVKEIARDSSYDEILRVGVTCGTLKAMHEKKGIIDLNKYEEIYDQIIVKKLR